MAVLANAQIADMTGFKKTDNDVYEVRYAKILLNESSNKISCDCTSINSDVGC